MYCLQCGTENEDTSRFCIKCGTELMRPAPPQPPPKTAAASKRNIVGCVLGIVGLLVVLVVIAGTGALVYQQFKPKGAKIGEPVQDGDWSFTVLESPVLTTDRRRLGDNALVAVPLKLRFDGETNISTLTTEDVALLDMASGERVIPDSLGQDVGDQIAVTRGEIVEIEPQFLVPGGNSREFRLWVRGKLTGSGKHINLGVLEVPTAPSLIAFLSIRGDNRGIRIIDSDGENEFILDSGEGSWGMSWSPDGRQLAHWGYNGLFIEPIDGGEGVWLAFGGYNVSWSPDGESIAYERAPHNSTIGEIVVRKADGTEVTLTDNDAEDTDPTWSATGDEIIFTSNRDGGWGVYTMDADGQNQTKLIESPIDAERIYAWPSPDGKHIAITTRNKDPEDSENYVFQSFVADTMQSDVRSLGELVFNDWSPDGRKLLTTTGMDIPEIVVVNPDGRDPTTLTSGYGPTWSPDGTMIAFVRDNHDPVNKYQLYVMNADGTDIRQLTTAGENFHPVWQGR